jgi:hypothetical protein
MASSDNGPTTIASKALDQEQGHQHGLHRTEIHVKDGYGQSLNSHFRDEYFSHRDEQLSDRC